MSDRCYNKISIQRDRCGGPVCFIAMPAWADLCRAADRTEKRKEETKAEEFKLGILEQVKDIALHFCLEGEIGEIIPYGNGHINDTFRISCRLADGGRKRYILQKMNRGVFKNPDELMENVMNITSFLHRKVLEAGGDPERETLEVIPTKEGKNYLENTDGECWRMYLYIEDVTSFYDVSRAEEKGYIRQSITGGFRLGVVRWMYLYLGGGYGEYGRLWENPSPVEGKQKFTSDYSKAPEAELGLALRMGNFSLSAGANALFGDKLMCDYTVSAGFYINFRKKK